MNKRKWTDKFCAICESKLTEKDSEHVCRRCFKAAREPKETAMVISEKAAQTLGIAYGLTNLVGWGIQQLVEYCRKAPRQDDKTFDCPLV